MRSSANSRPCFCGYMNEGGPFAARAISFTFNSFCEAEFITSIYMRFKTDARRS